MSLYGEQLSQWDNPVSHYQTPYPKGKGSLVHLHAEIHYGKDPDLVNFAVGKFSLYSRVKSDRKIKYIKHLTL